MLGDLGNGSLWRGFVAAKEELSECNGMVLVLEGHAGHFMSRPRCLPRRSSGDDCSGASFPISPGVTPRSIS